MGSFLSEGEVECKVGYTVDIQFTLNKDDWFFDTLEAVSTADAAESRQDYVQFTLNEKKSDKSKGIYVITVKLLKPAGDVLIKPKCLALPYIKSYTPATKSAQFANTPVVINFSIPVEAKDTSKSLINYDNILLTFDKPGDMKDYFFPPELNEDKTVLKLVPNAAKLKNYIINELEASFVDVTISLSDRIIVKNGEQEFPLRQDSNSTFTVRFGTESEETPPDERAFFVSGYEISLATASEFDDEKKLVPDKLSANLTIDDCKKNMIPSTIYIYGKYYDKDSGVRSIEVTEKYQGSYAINTTTYKNKDLVTNSYDLDSGNVVYVSENGYTTFILQYTIQATLTEEVGGGFFDLSFTIKDACDNSSESENVSVICMDYGDLTNLYVKNKEKETLNVNAGGWLQTNINVTNAVFSKAVEGSAGIYDFSKYNEDIKKIIIKDDKVRYDTHRPYYLIENNLYQELKLYCSEVKYVCEYIDRFGKKQRKPFTDYNADTLERSVVLDIDSVTGKSFTVIPMYNNVPLGRKTFYYPSVPLLKSIKTNQVDMYTSLTKVEYNYFANCIGICQYPDNSYKIIFGADAVFLNKPGFKVSNSNCKIYLGYLAPNYTGRYSSYSSDYQAQAYLYYDYVPGTDGYEKKSHDYNGLTSDGNPTNHSIVFGLLGDMIGPFENGQSAVAALTQPKIEGYTISKSQNKGYLDVTFKFASDIWNKYDSMTITNKSSSPEKTYNFTQNDTFVDGEYVCYTIPPIETKRFFSSSNPNQPKAEYYRCTAMKGSIIKEDDPSNKVSVGLSVEQRTEFDDMKPEALTSKGFVLVKNSYNNDLKKYDVFSFSDYGSGPKSGKMWLNGGNYTYDMQDDGSGTNTFIGKILTTSMKWGENVISYRLEDVKGNITEGTYTVNTKNWGTKNSSLTECPVYSNGTATLKFSSSINVKNSRIFQFDGINSSDKYPNWTDKTPASITSYEIPVTIESGKFYRVVHETTDAVYYAGSYNTAGDSNYVLANGSSNDSVVICANDTKVLVTVCSVSDKETGCTEWNPTQWKLFYDYKIENTFEVTSKVQKLYKIPAEYFNGYNNSIPTKSYYCIIVQFTNGDCIAGPVMHR